MRPRRARWPGVRCATAAIVDPQRAAGRTRRPGIPPVRGEPRPVRIRVMAVRVAAAPEVPDSPFGRISARQLALLAGGVALMAASLVLIAPAVADLPDALRRLEHGDA